MTYGPTGLYDVTNVGLVIQIQGLNLLRPVHVRLPQDTPPGLGGWLRTSNSSIIPPAVRNRDTCWSLVYWQTGDSSAVEWALFISGNV